MMSKQNVPELRFPEFGDEWEEKKFSDNYKKILDYRGKSPKKFNMEWGTQGFLVLSAVNVKNGYIDKNIEAKYGSEKLYNLWMGKDELKKDDVLFTTEAPLGNVAMVPDNEKYFLNQRTIAFRTEECSNSHFFAYLLSSPSFVKDLKRNSTGATALGISTKKLVKLTVTVPSTLKEQKKIGEFFRKLDRLIELEEKKLELLEKQKKGYMQKIFSQELRFKDENGNDYPEWEEKKLGEILGERVERSANGELLSVTISEGIKPFSQLDRKNNSSDNKDNYKKVYVGDIAYNSMRMWQGASGYSPYEGIVSPAYTVLYRKSEIDMEFMSYYFKTYQLVHTFKKFSQGLTSDTWNLKYPLLKTIPVYICSLNEQKKILSFFVKLDYRISQQKIKVNKMKLEKQGLIQRMFL